MLCFCEFLWYQWCPVLLLLNWPVIDSMEITGSKVQLFLVNPLSARFIFCLHCADETGVVRCWLLPSTAPWDMKSYTRCELGQKAAFHCKGHSNSSHWGSKQCKLFMALRAASKARGWLCTEGGSMTCSVCYSWVAYRRQQLLFYPLFLVVADEAKMWIYLLQKIGFVYQEIWKMKLCFVLFI